MENNYQINKMQYDECVARGICTISPELSFLQEYIKECIRELAFYLLKLKEVGITNEKIKEDIIETFSSLILRVNFTEAQICEIISKLYADLIQAKEVYISVYKKNNLKLEFIKSFMKINKKISLSTLKSQGQKIVNYLNSKTTNEQKALIDLIYCIMQSICIHLNELRSLDIDINGTYETFLNLANIRYVAQDSLEKFLDILYESADFDHHLLMKLEKTREEKYGEIMPAQIKTSTRPNKAILVSGTNLRELELLLEATKNQNIDIYTHGHMIMAHSFPKFKKYPNLFGHFGKGIESYLIDFAAFPGVIFLTKHFFHKIENLYRSRIFTSDIIAPKGVTLIKDNNYEPVINAALNAKGFSEGVENPPIKITLNEKKLLEKIDGIIKKIEKGEIKNILIIGLSNHTKSQKEYFEKLFELIEKDSFIISFSYGQPSENVLLAESDYGFPLLYRTLEFLKEKIDMEKLNLTFLATRCEVHTLSNIIYLKQGGIKNIFFADCSPHLINPSVVQTMREMFNLKKFTTPEADLKTILSQK